MLLYKFKKCDVRYKICKKFKIEIFRPKWYMLQKHRPFSLIHCLWFLFTRGNYRIIYVLDNKRIIHYTHVIPYFWKFNFMKKNDFEVGPCWTDEKYRGKGIYKYVIQLAVEKFSKDNASFYMIVDEKNISSIRGIEKSGFVKIGKVKKSKLTGIYYKMI